ncbi:MAG: hypothetical protein QF706_09465, partial [Roseibacillus sp.]|nr:hypothetical protein [Roseibacillus sp.]
MRSRALTVQFLRLVALLAFLVPGAGSALAAESLPQGAEVIAEPFEWLTITNSMVMVWVVAGVIILVSWLATRRPQLVPSGMQNFVEWLVESLINFFA